MSKIEWTNKTWNPVRGCSMAPGSELGGCLNCYAARLAARNLPEMRSPTTGEPFAIIRESGPRWTGKVELIRKKLVEPRHWKRRRMVFVNSMSDLFHESLPFHEIDECFDAMLGGDQHDYQILTKRGQRMFEYFDSTSSRSDYLAKLRLWLGVSVENPATAGARLPWLLRIPSKIRMVSYEPALEWIDFNAVPIAGGAGVFSALWKRGLYGHQLDWGIIGGESGPGARPFWLKWARGTIKTFRAAGTPLFLKQIGARPIGDNNLDLFHFLLSKHEKGGDPAEWPEDLRRAREFPYAIAA